MKIQQLPAFNPADTPAAAPRNPGLQAIIASEYSARAGGKTWSATVEPFAGEYFASVPDLPGAAASGPSIEKVESSLDHLINFFA